MTKLVKRRTSQIRGRLLNALKDGPMPYAAILEGAISHGFTEEEINAAGQWMGVISDEIDGARYWMRPANLFAIWWGKRPAHFYARYANQGGSAA
jgi:hypothetical protein